MQGPASPEPSAPPDPRLAGLIDRLGHARRRSVVDSFVEFATLGVLSALTLFCVLELLNALLGGMAPWLAFEGLPVADFLAAWRPAPVPQHLMLSVYVGLLAVVLSPLLAMLRKPPIDRLARAADQRFELHESMSTALEVSGGNRPNAGIVGEALLRSVERRTAEVEPKELVPVGLPRAAAGVPVMLAIAALLTVAPPPPLLEAAFGALRSAAEGVMTEAERYDGAATLHAIAAILRQDGEERGNLELQALAHELDRLADQLAAGNKMGIEDLAKGMEKLYARANEAYQNAGMGETAPGNFAKVIGAALAELQPKRPGKAVTMAKREDQPGWNKEGNPFTGLMTTRDEYNGPGRDDAKDMIPPGQITGDPGNGKFGAEADGEIDGLADFAPPDTDDPYANDLGPTGGGPMGEMVGGADGEGPGDYAGAGRGARLFGEMAARLGLNAFGEMLLENPAVGGGRRTRFNLPPQMEGGALGDGTTPNATGGWKAATEHEVTRTTLPVAARDAVSRYFRALMVERGR